MTYIRVHGVLARVLGRGTHAFRQTLPNMIALKAIAAEYIAAAILAGDLSAIRLH